MFIDSVLRQAQKSAIVNQLTVCKPQLSQTVPFRQQGGNRGVSDLQALMEVDLKDIGALLREGENSIITELNALVEFKLQKTIC